MLEYDGPANDSKITGFPTRWRHRKSTGPAPRLDASKARDKGLALPDVEVEGITLTARCFVENDKYADLDETYGTWRDSEKDARLIRKAKADGYLVIKREHVDRNTYDTWVSSEVVRQPRVAAIVTGECVGRYLNRAAARGPAYQEEVARQLSLYKLRLDDEIGASDVDIKLYLNGYEIGAASIGCELGSWRDEDENLASIVTDLMHEAKGEAATAIADLRAKLCPCQQVTA